MSRRTVASLLFLLVTQLLLLGLLYWLQEGEESQRPALLTVENALRSDTIRIVDDQQREVLLRRGKDQWQ
ncbi:MAG: hypothetical protein ACK5HY_15185, partial [Parahaliea sp.]